jgi:hypothetical protein
VKDLKKIPKHIEDISAVAPVISFAHGMDEPEVGLCLFADGKCATRFRYFSVETIKLELRNDDMNTGAHYARMSLHRRGRWSNAK